MTNTASEYRPQISPHSHYFDRPDSRLHFYRWGTSDAPIIVLLHGWCDAAISWQFVADTLARDYQLLALDWRGFGHSSHIVGHYYFPDYLADLEAFLEAYVPQPAHIVGHSMGGIVASLYAGIRPERVARLVSIEGYGLPDTSPHLAPQRYAQWLDQIRTPPHFRPISATHLAQTLQRRNPHLPSVRAHWLAQHLTHSAHTDNLRQLLADPKHKIPNPILYRLTEAQACWRRITAPVLWIHGSLESHHPVVHQVAQQLDERRSCIQNLTEYTFPKSGHMLHWEYPKELALTLRKFLSAGSPILHAEPTALR